jgi:hypothetical protein
MNISRFMHRYKWVFDTVIYPGMLIKMLKSDIGGNLYHLIKHMYTLNKLRVKVDNKLGQGFNSHIGVRQVVVYHNKILMHSDGPEIH